jgi:glycosyltransferase involved in cell wall biosynthesis
LAELVSIVIPVYNNPDGLLKTLESIRSLEDADCEVFAVDDGSARPLVLPSEFQWCRVVRLPKNQGTGLARNEGVRQSKGTILAFTDSDCAVPPDWLKTIRGIFADPKIQAAGGTFADETQTSAIQWLRFLESTFYHLHEPVMVNCFTTSNFTVRRAAFELAGGFPPMRIGEDLILGYKLSKLGIEVLWQPALRVRQNFRPTPVSYFRQQTNWSLAIFKISLIYPEVYFLKWPVRRGTLNLQLGILLTSSFLVPILLYRQPAAALVLAAVAFGFLLMLNAKFLSYAAGKTGPVNVVKIFLFAVFWRNLAWIAAIFSVILRHPVFFVAGAPRIVLQGLRKSAPSPALPREEILEIGRRRPLAAESLG